MLYISFSKGMEKSKSRTNLNVIFVCIISILISIPILILGYLNPKNTSRNGNCTIYNNNFKIYGSILSFIIPLGIMMVMYFLTVKRLKIVLKDFKLKCQKNNIRLSISSKLDSDDNKSKKKLTKQVKHIEKKLKFRETQKQDIHQAKPLNDLMLKPLENNLKPNNLLIDSSNNSLNKVSFKKITNEKLKAKILINNNNDLVNENNNVNEQQPNSPDEKPEVKKSRFKLIVNKHLIARQAIDAFKLSRESSVVKNQQKAVKVLGIVLVIFLIAWGPFALINILSAVCESCSISMFFLDVLTWLG